MKECVTLLGVVCDAHGVRMTALLGDLVFLKESFKLSHVHAPKQVQNVLKTAYVDLECPQLVVDGQPRRTSTKHLARVPFLAFIDKDYGEHTLATVSMLYASYLKQLEAVLQDCCEVQKDVSTR